MKNLNKRNICELLNNDTIKKNIILLHYEGFYTDSNKKRDKRRKTVKEITSIINNKLNENLLDEENFFKSDNRRDKWIKNKKTILKIKTSKKIIEERKKEYKKLQLESNLIGIPNEYIQINEKKILKQNLILIYNIETIEISNKIKTIINNKISNCEFFYSFEKKHKIYVSKESKFQENEIEIIKIIINLNNFNAKIFKFCSCINDGYGFIIKYSSAIRSAFKNYIDYVDCDIWSDKSKNINIGIAEISDGGTETGIG
jgi:hypothetical protein